MPDIDYISARVRAMKGRLLPQSGFEELLGVEDLSGVTEFLLRSPYAEELSSALSRLAGLEAIEEALSENLSKTLHRLITIVVGELRPPIRTFLERWDVYNIKTILRVLHWGLPGEEARGVFVPAGELDPPTLQQLLQQSDISSLINLLATWNLPYARPLSRAVGQYQSSKELWVLEYALDRDYYERAFRVLGQGDGELILIRKMIALQIDVTNAVLALRMSASGTSTTELASLLLPHGTVESSILETVSQAQSLQEALGALAGTWLAVQDRVVERVSDLERHFEETLIKKGAVLSSKEPSSLAPVLGFVWRKYNEFLNLRIIASGKALGTPEEEIRRELILV